METRKIWLRLSGVRIAAGTAEHMIFRIARSTVSRAHLIGTALTGKGEKKMADREKVIRELKATRLFLEMWSNRAGGVVGNLGCKSGMKYIDDALELLKEQEKRINELEEKLRLLEYGDQDTLQSIMMPAT